jgi:hypothetical protein
MIAVRSAAPIGQTRPPDPRPPRRRNSVPAARSTRCLHANPQGSRPPRPRRKPKSHIVRAHGRKSHGVDRRDRDCTTQRARVARPATCSETSAHWLPLGRGNAEYCGLCGPPRRCLGPDDVRCCKRRQGVQEHPGRARRTALTARFAHEPQSRLGRQSWPVRARLQRRNAHASESCCAVEDLQGPCDVSVPRPRRPAKCWRRI